MIGGTRARITTEISRQGSLASDIAKLQDQVSTTKKNGSPSDDPAGNLRLGAIRQTQSDQAAYAANVETAATLATRVDSAMTSLSTSLDQARELVSAGSSGTYSADDRKIAAAQLRGIAKDIGSLSAQKDSRGQPIFPDGTPLAIPIGEGKQETATVSKAALFGSGGSSLADILNAAADALENGDATARAAGTGTALDAIGTASSQVAQLHGDQGVRAARIDAQRESLVNDKVTLSDERSSIEGADVSAAIALITTKLNTLEAAQAVFAKLNKQTLFDLIG